MADLVYVADRWVLRMADAPWWWRRRWYWHVRYRESGQPLAELDRAVGGRAWTARGARQAMQRWLRGREVR